MLHWIEVENFHSFLETTRIDFTPGKVIDDYTTLTTPGGTRLNKVCGIFGANASGKTNLIRALARVSDFIANSFSREEKAMLPFKAHFFAEDKASRISIQFEVPDREEHSQIVSKTYRYHIEATEERVLTETLFIKTSRLYSRVFERKWNGTDYSIVGVGVRYKNNLPERVSFISWLARHEVPVAVRLTSYFRCYRNNDFAFLKLPSFFGALDAVEAYRKSDALKQKMVDLLQRWDIGLTDVQLESRKVTESDGTERETWDAIFVHKQGDKTAKLAMFSESSGTIGLFSQLSILLQVLETGGVAVIDELESDLHPEMIQVLLDLFISPETNPKNSQLVFTSHADWLMNVLNKWQIVLVEKRECKSQAWRLSDMQGILGRENHAARYRAGAYGAVPREIDISYPPLDAEEKALQG